MRKTAYLFTAALLLFSAVSCRDFLSTDENSFQTKTFQFSSFARTKSVVTNVYGYVRNYLDDVEGTMREAATDNAIYTWESNYIKTYYDGSWSASRRIDDLWSHYYAGIRAANYYLENCPEDFPGTEYTDNYLNKLKELRNYKYEVRILRAYFHFELAKRYNHIVICERSYEPSEINSLVPVTFQQAINWIVKEVDEVAPNLPIDYTETLSNEYGRVTRGMALALKCRALLYLASPLNNPTDDQQLWVNAAAAALEIIDSDDFNYTLASEEVVNNENSKELIFGAMRNSESSFEARNFPIGIDGASGGICPTANLAMAFDLKDGSVYDPDLNPEAMFVASAREKRFNRTLKGNGAQFNDAVVLETFYGGANGQPIKGATPTSFYLSKFVQSETVMVGNQRFFSHTAPIFRLSEIYLNYAEALFEATKNPAYQGKCCDVMFTRFSPVDALNKVRTRYNPSMKLPKTLSEEEFRERLRNERRCELAFEDHRFWDIRRWKIGPETTDIYGLNVVKDPGTEDITYSIELIQRRKWEDKYYWYPIPDGEIFKNPNLIQNPYW